MLMKMFFTKVSATTVAIALMAFGCSKVREPEPEAAPKVIDASGKTHHLNGPPPVIACDKAEYEFGTVSQGQDASHIFIIKNTGKGVLKIERARGG